MPDGETSDIKNTKSQHDARAFFSKYLVQLRLFVLQSSSEGIPSWIEALRHYYSNISGLTDMTKLNGWYDRLNKLNSNMNIKQMGTSHQSEYQQYLSTKVYGELFILQNELFEISAHLFMPLIDDIDSEEFDTKDFLGR